jgi:YVTN family beta-propeller protein
MAQTASTKQTAKAYVANFKDNTVSVIDTAAGKVVATVQVAAGPHGMAITQDGRTVYVSGDGSSSIDVIDTATDKVVKTINVGKAPNGVALTPDDRLLVVTVYGEDRIAFIDTSTQTVVANLGRAQAAYCRDQPQRQARVRHGTGIGPLRARPDRPSYAQRHSHPGAR